MIFLIDGHFFYPHHLIPIFEPKRLIYLTKLSKNRSKLVNVLLKNRSNYKNSFKNTFYQFKYVELRCVYKNDKCHVQKLYNSQYSQHSDFYFRNSFLNNFFSDSTLSKKELNSFFFFNFYEFFLKVQKIKTKSLFLIFVLLKIAKLKKKKDFLRCSKKKSFFYNLHLNQEEKRNFNWKKIIMRCSDFIWINQYFRNLYLNKPFFAYKIKALNPFIYKTVYTLNEVESIIISNKAAYLNTVNTESLQGFIGHFCRFEKSSLLNKNIVVLNFKKKMLLSYNLEIHSNNNIINKSLKHCSKLLNNHNYFVKTDYVHKSNQIFKNEKEKGRFLSQKKVYLFAGKKLSTNKQRFREINFLYSKSYLFSLNFLVKKSKFIFFKNYFFSPQSIPFNNCQINRFIYFVRVSKRTENPLSSTLSKVSLDFYNLDLFLFYILYAWAKKQHENNSNYWLFKKYWIFLQPFPYFFYTRISISRKIFFSEKKTIFETLKNNETIFYIKPNIYRNFIIFFTKFSTNILLNSCYNISLALKQNKVNKVKIKKGVLKTCYLRNYKCNFELKINSFKKQQKFNFYFSKLLIINYLILIFFKSQFSTIFEKEFNKNLFRKNYFKNFNYKHIKIYLINKDLYLIKSSKKICFL